MKFRHRLTPVALLALAALVSSCNDKTTNPTNNPPLELNSGDIASGTNFSHTFLNAGTYNYHCVHHSMSGSVIVSTGPATATVTIADNSYSPASVTVGVNATVTWHNTGTIHTVTSTP